MRDKKLSSLLVIIVMYLRVICVHAVDDSRTNESTFNATCVNDVILNLQKTIASLKRLEDSYLNDVAVGSRDLLENAKRTELSKLGYNCSDDAGWHKLYSTRKTWNSARKSCENEGAHLVIINSDTEAQVLSKWMKDADLYNVFIGIHDQFEEGEWISLMNQSINRTGYVHWLDGLPNNYQMYNNTEVTANCGTMNYDGAFVDVYCNKKYAYVCEIPLSAIC